MFHYALGNPEIEALKYVIPEHKNRQYIKVFLITF